MNIEQELMLAMQNLRADEAEAIESAYPADDAAAAERIRQKMLQKVQNEKQMQKQITMHRMILRIAGAASALLVFGGSALFIFRSKAQPPETDPPAVTVVTGTDVTADGTELTVQTETGTVSNGSPAKTSSFEETVTMPVLTEATKENTEEPEEPEDPGEPDDPNEPDEPDEPERTKEDDRPSNVVTEKPPAKTERPVSSSTAAKEQVYPTIPPATSRSESAGYENETGDKVGSGGQWQPVEGGVDDPPCPAETTTTTEATSL